MTSTSTPDPQSQDDDPVEPREETDGGERGQDPGTGDGQDAAPAASPDVADDASGRAVAVAGSGRRPPPRRTGVFVDADDLRTHVGELLRAILGGYQVDPFGNFSFTHDGARVYVSVGTTPVGLAVNVHSVTNIDLDLDEALATFIATTNHRLGFGALSWDTDNRAVWLRHTLLGTTLDAPELQAAVATVAQTAATIDDDIRQRFGGRTFDEAPADVRAATSPPTSRPTDDESGPADDIEGVTADNASGYL